MSLHALRNFLSITFLVALGDVKVEDLPALAAKADMFETIDITTLEAGGLTYGDVAESSPMTKEPAPVSGGKRKKKTTQDDLLQLQCETLQLQKETLVMKKRKLELEINQLEMSLSYIT